MSLKVILTALLFLGIGFVVGLPLGALRSGPVAAQAAGPSVKKSDGGSPAKAGTSSAATRPGSSFAPPGSLAARLLDLHRQEMHSGGSDILARFDAKAADLLKAHDTAAISALATEWSLRKDADAGEVLTTLFMHWALREAGAAWQAALKAVPEHQATALAGCLRALSTADHLAALQKLETIADEKLREQVTGLLKESAKRFWQPEPLARRLLALPASERPKDLLKDVVEEWMKRHFRGGLDFVNALPPAERDDLLLEFCPMLAVFDPDEALRLAGSFQDPKHSAKAWSCVLGGLSELRPEMMTSLLESLPLEEMDPSLFEKLNANSLTPEVVGRVAARLSGKSRDLFLSKVFQSANLFSSQQLQVRLDAIELRPEDGDWLTRVVDKMLQSSSANTIAWLDALPESRLRDEALASAAQSGHGDRHPEQAAQFALSIQEEKLRMREFRFVMDKWLRSDRTAAIAWLNQSGASLLPANERARWLSLSGARP